VEDPAPGAAAAPLAASWANVFVTRPCNPATTVV
jgi:predicted PhzF superfamily epimerase YddE/YHI9